MGSAARRDRRNAKCVAVVPKTFVVLAFVAFIAAMLFALFFPDTASVREVLAIIAAGLACESAAKLAA